MEECQNNQCSTAKPGECNQGPCPQSACQQPPCPQSQCQQKSCTTGCEMTDELLEIADSAWSHLMREKMKAQFEKINGKHMDSLAAAAVEASLAHWEGVKKLKAGKMKMKSDMAEAVRKVQAAMGKD